MILYSAIIKDAINFPGSSPMNTLQDKAFVMRLQIFVKSEMKSKFIFGSLIYLWRTANSVW